MLFVKHLALTSKYWKNKKVMIAVSILYENHCFLQVKGGATVAVSKFSLGAGAA
jgi:hypothetical protein